MKKSYNLYIIFNFKFKLLQEKILKIINCVRILLKMIKLFYFLVGHMKIVCSFISQLSIMIRDWDYCFIY